MSNVAFCFSVLSDLKLPTVLEPSYMPVFAGDSFIQRSSLSGVRTRLDVEIVFYTFETNGMNYFYMNSFKTYVKCNYSICEC